VVAELTIPEDPVVVVLLPSEELPVLRAKVTLVVLVARPTAVPVPAVAADP
jgi:hypothetical protein